MKRLICSVSKIHARFGFVNQYSVILVELKIVQSNQLMKLKR